MMCASVAFGQATLPVSRTSWTGAEPTGWSQSGTTDRTTNFACSGDNAATFDNTNDVTTVYFSAAPDQLVFKLKKASMSGASSMLVQRSDNGTAWTAIGTYGTASGATTITDCANITIALTAGTRYVRWTYTKATGNCDLDDVSISAAPADPTIVLSSPAQTGAANIAQSSTNNILSHFQAAVTVANATLNSLAFTTTGSYTAADLTGTFKLYYGSTNVFGSASSMATVAVGAAGTYTFSSLSQAITSGNTGYFWIVADASGTSGGNRTLVVAANPTLTFAAGTPSGSIAVGGTKTFITPSTPTLSATALTAFGNQCVNTTYGPNAFTITGSALTTANVTVAASAGYTYSTTAGGTYTSTLSLSQPGGAFSQDIYVKFTPTAATSYTASIVVGGGGASNINVAPSGTGNVGTVGVTTVAASAIGTASASSGGTGVSTTCGTITAKGVVWGTSANPTISTNLGMTSNGTGTANFTSSITSLTANTLYNYRAYATNSNGVTSYGTDLTFTTLKLEPTNYPTSFACGTVTISSIPLTWTGAMGAVLPDGYLIKWSTTSFAAISDPVDGTAQSNGAGVQNIAFGTNTYTPSGLSSGTTYYFKVWSYTNSGTGINYKTTGQPQVSCTTLSAPWEDFESGSNKTGYASGSSTYTAGSWSLDDALATTSDGNDAKNGSRSARVRSSGSLTMDFDLVNGLGTVDVLHARYGSDGNSTWRLEVSDDGGSSWTAFVSSTITTSSTTLTNQSFTVNVAGTVRFRLVKLSGGTGVRLNFDDIYVTDYTNPCVLPTTHASSLAAASITTTTANLSWTNGNGGSRIVVVREGGAVNANPVDNTTYTSSAVFGSGSQIGTGNFVVYRGTAISVALTGLTPGKEYFVKVFEYGCDPGDELYYTTGTPANTNLLTEPATPVSFSSVCISDNSIDLIWQAPAGSVDGYLLVARANSGEHAVTSLVPTSQGHALNFSAAPTFGGTAPNSRVLYVGTGTSATVTGLTTNTTYTFRVYAYALGSGSTYKYSSGTSVARTIKIQDVTFASATGNDQAALVSWTNPSAACFDEIMVVANQTAGIGFTPSGDGTAYSPNSTYAAPDQVVYKADFNTNTVDVSNLVNGTTYYFEIFVRKGTSWSAGVEVFTIPNDITNFGSGDMAIVAVNTQYQSSGSNDEVCFFSFQDITVGSSIEFNDNGYERVSADLWGDTEGVIRITRTSGGTVPAGTVLCLQGAGNQPDDFTVKNCGANDDAHWSIYSLNGDLFDFDLNSNDQIWLFQNGAWSNPSGSHNATYTGDVVWGWTATGWMSSPGYSSTAGSTRPEDTECFTIDLNGISNNDKVKYTGSMASTDQIGWIRRINDPANWTGYSTNGNYNAGGQNYSGGCITFPFSSIGFQAGRWGGVKSTNWHDCNNWDDLRVPDQNTDVLIPSTSNDPHILTTRIGECHTIEIETDTGAELYIDGTGRLDVTGP